LQKLNPNDGGTMARSTIGHSDVTPKNGRTKSEVKYDAELFELWVNGALVKRLDARATNQILILSAFQEMHWVRRIDDPLVPADGADGKARLRSTIHCLNGCQHPPAIHFFADGTGHGIRWELAADSSPV
jgi:hypothetical protein